MTGSLKRDWRAIGCAAALGAVVAFPIGLVVGGKGPAREDAATGAPAARARDAAPTSRNLWSPRIVSDPYVIEQQRRVLRALETSCRRSGEHCAEAGQARRRIAEAEAEAAR